MPRHRGLQWHCSIKGEEWQQGPNCQMPERTPKGWSTAATSGALGENFLLTLACGQRDRSPAPLYMGFSQFQLQ